ncbi:hypothetical protein Bbelb_249460 [Branchiostoma belcheri]|nr:hypothetical protein Bbelb_249460 [Branchiostoma belcheri]
MTYLGPEVLLCLQAHWAASFHLDLIMTTDLIPWRDTIDTRVNGAIISVLTEALGATALSTESDMIRTAHRETFGIEEKLFGQSLRQTYASDSNKRKLTDKDLLGEEKTNYPWIEAVWARPRAGDVRRHPRGQTGRGMRRAEYCLPTEIMPKPRNTAELSGNADFLTCGILEKTKMARQLGRVAWYGDSFAYCFSSGDSCLNLTREDWTRPDDLKTEEVWNISSGDSCLNLTREDWTRPDDLKTQEEYQLTAVMILNPTRPDVRVLRNLVTGNFSLVQTSKSDDLKTQ